MKYDNTQLVEDIKTSKYLKKQDIFVVIVLLFALVGVIVLLCMPQGEKVVIRVDGKIQYVLDLNEDREIPIVINGENANIVVIKDKKVYISNATCPNHDCVNAGKIDKIGQSISCLPHKLIVEIVAKNSEVDTII